MLVVIVVSSHMDGKMLGLSTCVGVASIAFEIKACEVVLGDTS